jgi:hypothetical protein
MPKTEVKVIKYKGNKAAQKGIEKMLNQGWQLQDQATRKQVFSLATGIFTRKQIHNITFIREVETRKEKREAKNASVMGQPAVIEQAAVAGVADADDDEPVE